MTRGGASSILAIGLMCMTLAAASHYCHEEWPEASAGDPYPSSPDPGLPGRHPLNPDAQCPALGPQAVMERLRSFVNDITAEQRQKYLKIIDYLKDVPKALKQYLWGHTIDTDHALLLSEFRRSVQQRFQLVLDDVLLPWRQLATLHQLTRYAGFLQVPAQHTLMTNLELVLAATTATETNILDNISGLVEQYRLVFINYKSIMQQYVDNSWPDDSAAARKQTLVDNCRHEFTPILAKPLLYLLEDEKLEYYHDHPSGFEPVFAVLSQLRETQRTPRLVASDDDRWQHLLETIPKGGTERAPPTEADIAMEEEVLGTHIVNMMTGYPAKKNRS